MSNLIWASIPVFILLVLMFFIFREGKRCSDNHLQSWKLVLWGGGLLLWGGNLNRILNWSQTQITSTFQLQIFNLVEIFSYVVGGGVILIGLLKWHGDSGEVKKNASRRLRQLTCLHSVLSTINHHQEMDEILKGALANVLNIMGYKMGVVYKSTFNSPEMKLVAHQGISADKLYTIFDLYANHNWFKESILSKQVTSTSQVETLPEYGSLFSDEDQIGSFACVPIKFAGRILGLVGLYDTKPDRFSYQEIQFLTCLGETLGLSVRQNLASHRNKKRRSYLSALGNISDAATEGITLQEVFPQLVADIKRIMDFDQISLYLKTGTAKDPEVITIGKSGGVLVEHRRGGSNKDNIFDRVMDSRKAWVAPPSYTPDDKADVSLHKTCGIKSLIILPIVYGDSTYGALSLGHGQSEFYSASDEKWLGPLILMLARIAFEQTQKERLIRREFLDHSLGDFEKRLTGEEDVYPLLRDVTAKLSAELPKSFVRLTLLNQKKDQLICCATHQIRSAGIELKNEERFPLRELPWHRLVLSAKRPMLINQEDPESYMSKDEAGLIMDKKIKSGILVPLLLDDLAVGILSIGEMRSWDREPLTEAEIGHMKHRANQVSIALKKGLLCRVNARLKEKLRKIDMPKGRSLYHTIDQGPFFDLSYKINNSLTAIRGSAELIRYSMSNLNPGSLKYLKTIENGVDRIHSCLEEFSYSPHVEDLENKRIQAHKEPVSF